MSTRAVLTATLVASACFAGGRGARADTTHVFDVRQINTAPRLIGCSSSIQSCNGATSIRTGLVVVDVESQHVRRGSLALVAMFQASAKPEQALLASQLMIGGGPRLTLGRAWLQAGAGLAGATLARGPKTIRTTSVLGSGAPAVMLGVGTWVAPFEVPLQLSLDLGSSLGVLDDDHLGEIYQVTANVLATNL